MWLNQEVPPPVAHSVRGGVEWSGDNTKAAYFTEWVNPLSLSSVSSSPFAAPITGLTVEAAETCKESPAHTWGRLWNVFLENKVSFRIFHNVQLIYPLMSIHFSRLQTHPTFFIFCQQQFVPWFVLSGLHTSPEWSLSNNRAYVPDPAKSAEYIRDTFQRERILLSCHVCCKHFFHLIPISPLSLPLQVKFTIGITDDPDPYHLSAIKLSLLHDWPTSYSITIWRAVATPLQFQAILSKFVCIST